MQNVYVHGRQNCQYTQKFTYNHFILFVVLDQGLTIINQFLFSRYYRTLEKRKNEDYAFYDKNPKKVNITSNFTEFSRTPNGTKVMISILTCKLWEFFFVLEFFKTDLKRLFADQKSIRSFWPQPTLGGQI